MTEEAAEKVLKLDPHCVKGVFIKAEALYYNCNFEKAMVMYHQGMVSFYLKIEIYFVLPKQSIVTSWPLCCLLKMTPLHGNNGENWCLSIEVGLGPKIVTLCLD